MKRHTEVLGRFALPLFCCPRTTIPLHWIDLSVRFHILDDCRDQIGLSMIVTRQGNSFPTQISSICSKKKAVIDFLTSRLLLYVRYSDGDL